MKKNRQLFYAVFFFTIQCSSSPITTAEMGESPVTEDLSFLDDSNALFTPSEASPVSSEELQITTPSEHIDSSVVLRQNFIAQVEKASVRFVASDQVAVRNKPAMSGKIIRFLSKGEKVHITKETDLWSELNDGFFILTKDLSLSDFASPQQ